MKTSIGEATRRAKRNARNSRRRRRRLERAREKGTHTGEQWESLCEWAGGCCVRCGDCRYPVEKDHIKPLYQGGSDAIDNLQPLCARCNASKGPESINWILRNDWCWGTVDEH